MHRLAAPQQGFSPGGWHIGGVILLLLLLRDQPPHGTGTGPAALFCSPHLWGSTRRSGVGKVPFPWDTKHKSPPNAEINFKTTTERQPRPIKCCLLLGAKWRFLPLIIKMAGKTLHDMISYIKQILWWRRLLVALFADLAFRQLTVIKCADLKYLLHLFKGAINKTLKPIKGAGFLGLFVKPADRLTS